MGRTAHRAIDGLSAADALYFGDVAPDAVYLGDTLIYSGGGGVANYFTGGVVTVADGYRYHTFNTSSTLTFVDADGLGTAVDVDYLVVAGGGGAAGSPNNTAATGGAGAGGYLANTASLGATQIVTVGAGGAGTGAATNADGLPGSASSLGAISATGGGGGGRAVLSNGANLDGGSGGGAGQDRFGEQGTAVVGQGNPGGDPTVSSINRISGGGGGAGSAGGAGTASASGNGGAGLTWLDGVARAGGGGGGTNTGTNGTATAGGGTGSQASTSTPSTAGTPNTGGGAGGGCFPGGINGAAGGSGVVIVRYADDPSMPVPGTYFDGTNYATTPSDAALDISGDFNVVVHVALDDWTPSSAQVLFGRTYFNYEMRVDVTTGYINFTINNSFNVNSAVAPTVSNGEALWVGFTCDVDDGGGSYQAKFWTSTDGVAWTQLGTTKTGAAFTVINSVRAMAVGARPDPLGSLPTSGTFYSAGVYDGSGAATTPGSGTLVAEVDLSEPWPGGTYTDAAGNDWTFV